MKEKIFDFEERLVRFAGEIVFFTRKLSKDFEIQYYKKQLIRSSGSATLNYGEAQGTVTKKDFINKTSLVIKELKESRSALKVLVYINEGDPTIKDWLITEVNELIAISSAMVLNKMG